MTNPTGAAPVAVTLWRCDACGKWSHAKRRPRFHSRWESSGFYPDEYRLPTGAFIKCGPFSRWQAVPA